MNKIIQSAAGTVFGVLILLFVVQAVGWYWPSIVASGIGGQRQLADVMAGVLGGTEPVISLNGPSTVYLNVGDSFNAVDQGASAQPSKPSYYLSGIRRDGGNVNGGWDVDTSKPATLTITYKVTQCTANSCGSDPSTFVGSSVVSRQVVISAPVAPVTPPAVVTPPVTITPTSPTVGSTPTAPTVPSVPLSSNPKITLLGANPLYINVGQNFNFYDPGVLVQAGNPTQYISGVRRNGGNANSGWDVDTSKPTTLTITYKVNECVANGCSFDATNVLGTTIVGRQVIVQANGGATAVTPPTTPVIPIFPVATTTALITPTAPSTPSTSITAASCSAVDVQKALNAVSVDGTTVNIPAGTCRWTTAVTYSQKYSTIVRGAGAKTSAGGTDQTVIIDDVNHDGNDPATFKITTAAGKGFRLTGIALMTDAANKTVAWNGMIVVSGSSQSLRIDNNHFVLMSLSQGVDLQGFLYGVLDHNLFDATVGSSYNDIRFGEPAWNNDPQFYGEASWADSSYFGSGKFIFAEGNTFNGGFAVDCSNGGRFVFRDNISNGSNLQTHGLTPDVRAGCRAMEVYGNNFTYSSHPIDDNFAFTLMLESGTGLFWGNTITGYLQFIHEDTVRANKSTYSYPSVPSSWGYCGSQFGPSSWDGNTDATGYPCDQQVGRGKGDMVTGSSFPNIINSVTGTQSWVHQVLDPVYVWGNLYNPVPQESYDALWSNATNVTKENRDYYLQLPNYNEPATQFNGTAGVGSGLLSSRPASCTAGVGYWGTDTGLLYECSAANTWTVSYAPYACPNPLITSGFVADAPGTTDASYCKMNAVK